MSEAARPLHAATPDEILQGEVTDPHFLRTREVLEAAGRDPVVTAEIRPETIPWPWAVLSGTAEVLSLLSDRPVDAVGLPEGSVIYAEEPAVVVSGRYLEFGDLTTSLLGVLCQATGVATAAARLKLAARGLPVYASGARRIHPAVAPVVDRAAYVGGCDAVSTVKGGELVGVAPAATIDHDLALLLGEEEAWRAFDQTIDRGVPRIVTVDTSLDERAGAVAAAEALGSRLTAVRLDVPASRRGDLGRILREVRWELDARGHHRVRILVSGNLGESAIRSLSRHADGFYVEDAIAAAPVVDFGLEIVEVDDQPRARRGILSGRKHLWRCEVCGNRGIAPAGARLGRCPRCRGHLADALVSMLRNGRPVGGITQASAARRRAIAEARIAAGVQGPGEQG
ncbi:MAG TPA: nicotinate phosphoribosyltransferase [Actinomycetota bacterium]|nr:nicotinate phosphoribosyltransferase [Actinomycetota bacterium]